MFILKTNEETIMGISGILVVMCPLVISYLLKTLTQQGAYFNMNMG